MSSSRCRNHGSTSARWRISTTSPPRFAHVTIVAERHDVLRIKGFIEVRGKPARLLVQGVGSRFQKSFDRPWGAGEARQGRLVIIGQKGLDKAAIAKSLNSAWG